MKIQLFVEGDLEQKILPAFFARWLTSHGLRQVPEFPKPHNFEGIGRFIKKIGPAAGGFLHDVGPGEQVAAIGIADLKDPIDHSFFPDDVVSVQDRYDFAVTQIQEQVNDSRFRMYFSVHELEAWLLAEPQLFGSPIKDALAGIAVPPEEVDFDEPPGKLLTRLHREAVEKGELKHTYRKTGHGMRYFSQLDPEIAYDKCPYLKRLLDDLLALAQEAGLE